MKKTTQFLFLIIGLCMSSYIVAALMDLLSIGMYSFFGIPAGLGATESMLKLWPGGNVIAMVAFGSLPDPIGIVKSIFSLILVVFIKGILPPLTAMFNFKTLRIIKYGIIDAVITIIISGLLTLVYDKLIATLFSSVAWAIVGGVSFFALVIGGTILLLIALKRVVNPFGFVFNFGKFALATFALIVWSENGIAGAFTTALCVIACGALVIVEYNVKGFWGWGGDGYK